MRSSTIATFFTLAMAVAATPTNGGSKSPPSGGVKSGDCTQYNGYSQKCCVSKSSASNGGLLGGLLGLGLNLNIDNLLCGVISVASCSNIIGSSQQCCNGAKNTCVKIL